MQRMQCNMDNHTERFIWHTSPAWPYINHGKKNKFTISFQNVERAFSLLFRRFPRLHLLNMKSEQKKIKVVMAACMLHNICIMENDNVDYYLQKAKEVCIPFSTWNKKTTWYLEGNFLFNLTVWTTNKSNLKVVNKKKLTIMEMIFVNAHPRM